MRKDEEIREAIFLRKGRVYQNSIVEFPKSSMMVKVIHIATKVGMPILLLVVFSINGIGITKYCDSTMLFKNFKFSLGEV